VNSPLLSSPPESIQGSFSHYWVTLRSFSTRMDSILCTVRPHVVRYPVGFCFPPGPGPDFLTSRLAPPLFHRIGIRVFVEGGLPPVSSVEQRALLALHFSPPVERDPNGGPGAPFLRFCTSPSRGLRQAPPYSVVALRS